MGIVDRMARLFFGKEREKEDVETHRRLNRHRALFHSDDTRSAETNPTKQRDEVLENIALLQRAASPEIDETTRTSPDAGMSKTPETPTTTRENQTTYSGYDYEQFKERNKNFGEYAAGLQNARNPGNEQTNSRDSGGQTPPVNETPTIKIPETTTPETHSGYDYKQHMDRNKGFEDYAEKVRKQGVAKPSKENPGDKKKPEKGSGDAPAVSTRTDDKGKNQENPGTHSGYDYQQHKDRNKDFENHTEKLKEEPAKEKPSPSQDSQTPEEQGRDENRNDSPSTGRGNDSNDSKNDDTTPDDVDFSDTSERIRMEEQQLIEEQNNREEQTLRERTETQRLETEQYNAEMSYRAVQERERSENEALDSARENAFWEEESQRTLENETEAQRLETEQYNAEMSYRAAQEKERERNEFVDSETRNEQSILQTEQEERYNRELADAQREADARSFVDESSRREDELRAQEAFTESEMTNGESAYSAARMAEESAARERESSEYAAVRERENESAEHAARSVFAAQELAAAQREADARSFVDESSRREAELRAQEAFTESEIIAGKSAYSPEREYREPENDGYLQQEFDARSEYENRAEYERLSVERDMREADERERIQREDIEAARSAETGFGLSGYALEDATGDDYEQQTRTTQENFSDTSYENEELERRRNEESNFAALRENEERAYRERESTAEDFFRQSRESERASEEASERSREEMRRSYEASLEREERYVSSFDDNSGERRHDSDFTESESVIRFADREYFGDSASSENEAARMRQDEIARDENERIRVSEIERERNAFTEREAEKNRWLSEIRRRYEADEETDRNAYRENTSYFSERESLFGNDSSPRNGFDAEAYRSGLQREEERRMADSREYAARIAEESRLSAERAAYEREAYERRVSEEAGY